MRDGLESEASQPAVAVIGVSKRVSDTMALDDVTLSVGRGKCVALLGPNGAGKTTLISLITGLRRPDRGRVELFGRNPRDWRARQRLGVVFQEIGFPPHLRVRELAILVAAHYHGAVTPGDLLARFSLAAVAAREVGRLSPGQRRRLAVALAFAGNPDLLVLDEPGAGLDLQARENVWDELRKYTRSGGSVILTTHSLEEVEALAHAVVLLHRGHVRAAGAAAEIMASPELTAGAWAEALPPPVPPR
jgi:ABC-2 type transport system ATP-binding protein